MNKKTSPLEFYLKRALELTWTDDSEARGYIRDALAELERLEGEE